ncbi:MAG: sporulation peptidase YabG, partial [Bacillota bacterium]
MKFNVGDLVTRKSYKSDIIFEIEKILENRALLRSIKLRLMADASLSDLKLYNKNKNDLKNDLLLESYQYIYRLQRNLILNNNSLNLTRHNNSYRKHSAKILHLDGDEHFLELSLQNYQNLNLNVKGIYIEEKGQPKKILNYLK